MSGLIWPTKKVSTESKSSYSSSVDIIWIQDIPTWQKGAKYLKYTFNFADSLILYEIKWHLIYQCNLLISFIHKHCYHLLKYCYYLKVISVWDERNTKGWISVPFSIMASLMKDVWERWLSIVKDQYLNHQCGDMKL